MSSEELNAQRIRLHIADQGRNAWRNNNGACQDQTGRLIRYGLANDSKDLNERIKSSDLIGITPIIVMPYMVGMRLGVFTAIETKATPWHLTPGDKRGQAQARFHEIVRADGGFAGFAQTVEDYERIVRL
jgi:hypothetical protein